MGYFHRIYEVSRSILIGMNVTLKHMLTPETVVTKQYMGLRKPKPGVLAKVIGLTEGYEAGKELEPLRYYRDGATIAPVKPLDYLPERHRGLHYLETEKCIMCFQCSTACPVDCIDIEGTRDGNIEGAHRADKATLTRFTIDYSLCIFCDLCTLACPERQKCIIMGKEFDLASYDQSSLVKNLLTDQSFDRADRDFVLEARGQIDDFARQKAAGRTLKSSPNKLKKSVKACAAAKDKLAEAGAEFVERVESALFDLAAAESAVADAAAKGKAAQAASPVDTDALEAAAADITKAVTAATEAQKAAEKVVADWEAQGSNGDEDAGES